MTSVHNQSAFSNFVYSEKEGPSSVGFITYDQALFFPLRDILGGREGGYDRRLHDSRLLNVTNNEST